MSPSASAADIRIGSILRETYELTSLLGKGGMGSVFLARHLRLPGKQVAVKVLLRSDDLSEEQYARFRREAEIASQLGHPNIIEVVDFHSLEDGTPYLVMEYLRGESLAQRLRKGRLSIREAFSIARQMGSALQAAHRAGVVHRDLKPANVFLVPTDSEGTVTERVKLLDFGISKLMGSQTLQTQDDILMGTPRYMSPEQAMGRNKEVDSRTDIFAFGSIVYEMLSGDSPFAGASIAEVVYRVVHENPESLAARCPDLPGRAVAAVDRALAKNPKDRYQDVGTFIAELTGIALQSLAGLGGDPTPFPPRGAHRPSADPSLDDEKSGTDATFVPSSSGAGGVPAPQAATPEQHLERDPTVTSARLAAQAPEPPPTNPLYGERRPAAPEQPSTPAPNTQPLPPRAAGARSKTPLVAGAIALVVLLAVATFVGRRWMESPDTPGPSTPPPTAAQDTPAPDATKPVTEKPPVAQTPPVVAQTETPPPSTNVETPTPPANPPPTSERPVKPPKQNKPEVLRPEVRKLLAEAERELDSGDWEKAIRIANRSLGVQTTEAASLLIGRARCNARDLGGARAQWNQLSPQGKKTLSNYCKKYDISL